MTKEPAIRNTTNGGIVYSNSLAVTRSYKKEGEPEADFLNITAFGKTAEFMQKYMSNKGQQILIESHVQNRTWDDDQGQKHYATDFIVDRCYFADTKRNNEMSDEVANNIVSDFRANGVSVSQQDSDFPF